MVPHYFGTRITASQYVIDRNFSGNFRKTVKIN